MQNPIDFIKDVFKEKAIVFLAEDHAIKDNLLFVKSLIPYLYEIGVDFLGMEFGASEDQDILDSLVTGKNYNKALARELMFHYNVIFPYKEYTDLYRAVFDFNKTLASSQRPFRILNLSYVYDWSEFTLPETEEKRRKVFYKGNTETYRFELLKEEVIKTNKKILILTGTVHALTKYRYKNRKNNYFGQYVYDYCPDKTYSIHLHEYFDSKEMTNISPCNGEVERVCLQNGSACAFDLNSNKLGDLEVNGLYSNGYEKLLLKDVFDGYIYLKKLDDRVGCTVDYEFLNDHNLLDILKQFPDPNWHVPPQNMEEYWEFVKDYVDLSKRN
ncbi:hypothetical protein RJI07_02970 [Mycoplasmatota bacterium WC30]